ncbi:hypothetical protein ACFXTH_028211 [Malus domestica]
MPMEIEIEIGEGEGERKTETVRQREKEREEWGSQRHCCRSLIFFDPISVFFSASHSRSITRPLTHSLQDTHEKAFHCAVATATVHLLLLRDSLLPTSRENVVAAAVGKVFSCLCDFLCPSNL